MRPLPRCYRGRVGWVGTSTRSQPCVTVRYSPGTVGNRLYKLRRARLLSTREASGTDSREWTPLYIKNSTKNFSNHSGCFSKRIVP